MRPYGKAHLLDGTHGVLRQRHGRGHSALPAVRHHLIITSPTLDPCGARLVHRRMSSSSSRRRPQLHLRLRRGAKLEASVGRDLKRRLQPSAGSRSPTSTRTASAMSTRASCRYRPHCEHARLEHGRGRVAFGVSRVRHRYDAHPQLEDGAVRARDRCRSWRSSMYFQKKLVLPHRQVREEKLPHLAPSTEGHHRRDDDETLVVEDKMEKEFDELTADMKKVSVARCTSRDLHLHFTTTLAASRARARPLARRHRHARGVMLIGTLTVFMNYAQGMMERSSGSCRRSPQP